ncbi:sigma-54 interaction domain-containing protein [Parasphingorhabdus cellanae]|uniref:Sigma-54-dependent Fis family transcriptional regulator n=1 Tax=Parasphingorhabdus cellanae TaxID=2806553 RepID=A0ABX7T674_9SPHN|nr:sigma-54 dependent transcriptional regulator [Parasphingorhabdus cellanae]QTD55468.1 sigma-54-dependent Fis family transcriptional regulator [Parasphingorhabdus cellanae]
MNDANVETLLAAKLIGNSPKMQQLRMLVKFAGRCNSSIMISGPSGSGKEVVADAIHTISQRADAPNITVNCGALPEQLIESELFGHEKGSFTGAFKQHVGLFEQSNGGTIFLDEIGDMPLNMQVKLLRVLESRIVNRVGGNQNIPIDVRVIAASHKNLGTAIQRGSFREDLFYRLCVVPIEVPALHERTEDIPALVEHFLKHQSEDVPSPIFTPEAYAVLQSYDWPGNVRELRNVVERATVFFAGQLVQARDIAALVQSDIVPAAPRVDTQPSSTFHNQSAASEAPFTRSFPNNGRETPFSGMLSSALGQQTTDVVDLNAHLQSEERRIILHALNTSHGVVSKAARSINIKRTTFIDKMRKHNIDKHFENDMALAAGF